VLLVGVLVCDATDQSHLCAVALFSIVVIRNFKEEQRRAAASVEDAVIVTGHWVQTKF
jgi:hypothetical protein